MVEARKRQDTNKLYRDPKVGVDNPHTVVRLLVGDAVRAFTHLTGKAPTLIHIPLAVEAALQIDLGRRADIHGKIRETQADDICGCKPVWDAEYFRVE